MVTEDRLEVMAPIVRARRPDVPLLVVTRAVAEAVTGYDVHRGILAAADRPPPCSIDSVVRSARTVVVLEDLTDQVNIGSVFRNAAALGADAVMLSPSCGDPLYRRAVRVSMGAVLTLPFCRSSHWPGDLSVLGAAGFCVYALTPDSDAEPLAALRPSDINRVALVLGSEGPGLTSAALCAADRRVRVEMAPGADSLNVATAAAVALYSIARRR